MTTVTVKLPSPTIHHVAESTSAKHFTGMALEGKGMIRGGLLLLICKLI